MSITGWLEAAGVWTLLLIVKLGLPVVVISCISYCLYLQHRRKSRALAWSKWRQNLGKVEREGTVKRCWEIQGCSPEIRERCPAYWQPGIPCWIALKQMFSGRIQSKCLNCSLLLSR